MTENIRSKKLSDENLGSEIVAVHASQHRVARLLNIHVRADDTFIVNDEVFLLTVLLRRAKWKGEHLGDPNE